MTPYAAPPCTAGRRHGRHGGSARHGHAQGRPRWGGGRHARRPVAAAVSLDPRLGRPTPGPAWARMSDGRWLVISMVIGALSRSRVSCRRLRAAGRGVARRSPVGYPRDVDRHARQSSCRRAFAARRRAALRAGSRRDRGVARARAGPNRGREPRNRARCGARSKTKAATAGTGATRPGSLREASSNPGVWGAQNAARRPERFNGGAQRRNIPPAGPHA